MPALPDFYSPKSPAILGIIYFAASAASAQMDHIIVNGNRDARVGSQADVACINYSTIGATTPQGFNVVLFAPQSKITNSVTEYSLCGSGLLISSVHDVLIWNNTVYRNGNHQQWPKVSDGITIGDAQRLTLVHNQFIENSDVDLIFGGCQDCTVQNNQITHSNLAASHDHRSNVAMMLQSWFDPKTGTKSTSGDYTGSDFSNNTIDCGAGFNCGAGILIGNNTFYGAGSPLVFGGTTHQNKIAHAKQGFVISAASDMGAFSCYGD